LRNDNAFITFYHILPPNIFDKSTPIAIRNKFLAI